MRWGEPPPPRMGRQWWPATTVGWLARALPVGKRGFLEEGRLFEVLVARS